MTVLSLLNFIGEQPRVIPRMMPDTAAQSAINCRLDDGGLTPINRSSVQSTDGNAAWETLYRHAGVWMGWNAVVHAAPGPIADDRLYFTGDGVPKVMIEGVTMPLGLAYPETRPTVTINGTGSGDVVTRAYAYTYVTQWGEESEPSPASTPAAWRPGQTVTLSGFTTPPTGRGFTRQRIYRSQTGQSGTYLYLIAERAATTDDFVDTVAVNDFQEPLPSIGWNAPPDDMVGLTVMPNGIMSAFSGRRLYFCEPYYPHAWPERYVLTTEAPIVGLCATGDVLLVLTTAQPYIVQGSAPDAMQMQKLEQNLPCINARGIVDLGYACAYPTHEGLVVVDAGGGARLVTGNIFSRRDWLALSPQTMVAAQLSGRYVAFYEAQRPEGSVEAGTLMIDTSGTGFLVRSDTRAVASFFEVETSGLYYVDPETGYIMQFDPLDTDRRFQLWKSKEFVLPRPENFSCILIEGEDTITPAEQKAIDDQTAMIVAQNAALFALDEPLGGALGGAAYNVYAVNGDRLRVLPAQSANLLTVTIRGDKEIFYAVTAPNRVMRLPAKKAHRKWEIEVYANIKVERIKMATSLDELRATP